MQQPAQLPQVLPPKHQKIRFDSVVNDVIANSRVSKIDTIPATKEYNYAAKER